jgi:hypothetical protein
MMAHGSPVETCLQQVRNVDFHLASLNIFILTGLTGYSFWLSRRNPENTIRFQRNRTQQLF